MGWLLIKDQGGEENKVMTGGATQFFIAEAMVNPNNFPPKSKAIHITDIEALDAEGNVRFPEGLEELGLFSIEERELFKEMRDAFSKFSH